jgi:hypothetical protein
MTIWVFRSIMIYYHIFHIFKFFISNYTSLWAEKIFYVVSILIKFIGTHFMAKLKVSPETYSMNTWEECQFCCWMFSRLYYRWMNLLIFPSIFILFPKSSVSFSICYWKRNILSQHFIAKYVFLPLDLLVF